MTVTLDSAELATFAPLVGDSIEVVDPSTTETAFTVTLAEASALPARGSGLREPFSLMLEGPAANPLPQGTFRFRHPAIGELDIFIVPVAERNDVRRYQAIFS